MTTPHTPAPKATWDRNNFKPTSPWMRPFLHHYSITGNVSEACRKAGIDRSTYYEARQRHEPFALACADAAEDAADLLEQQAWQIATTGLEKTVEHYGPTGELLSVERTMSVHPTILIFLLKGLRPQKYRENFRIEQTGADGGPIKIDTTDVAAEFDAELRRLATTDE